MPREPAWDNENSPTDPGPPGHFLSDDLRSDTERFLAEVKRLVRRRRVVEENGVEPSLDADPAAPSAPDESRA